MTSSLATGLHALAAVLWVGGMFFAYQVLRPAMGTLAPPPERLKLWSQVFRRFFPWVWAAVILLPATGYLLIATQYGGFEAAPIHVHWMHGTGWLMIALYIYLYFAPYRALTAAVAAEDWPTGGAQLAVIRKIVGTNLILGLITIALGATGRFWAWVPGN